MRHLTVIRRTATVVAVTMFGFLLPTYLATSPAFAVDAQVTAPPPPPPPTVAQEAVRANFQAFLAGLQSTVNAVKANPSVARNLASGGNDATASIASAQQLVAQFTSTQLDSLQGALTTSPSWQQAPGKLSASVAAFRPATFGPLVPKDFAGAFTDSCASAGSAVDGFQNAYIANQVQSALQAVMIAAPGVIALFFFDIPDPVKIVLAIAWGIANGVYLALAKTAVIQTDCAATAFANTQTATLPTDPGNSGVFVAGSSEISILNLIAAAQGTQQEITNVQNTINAIGLQADTLISAAAALNTTLADINGRVSETQTDLQLLKTYVDVLINTEGIDLTKADKEIVNLTTFQTLQLRMDIEENLTRNGAGTGPMALFQLPTAKGGYLEMTKAIVVETIAKETAVGHGNTKATVDLNTANTAFTSGQFKTAYDYYSKAYQDVR